MASNTIAYNYLFGEKIIIWHIYRTINSQLIVIKN